MERLTEKDIFIPVANKDMRRTYPELARIYEFSKLRALELKFCWYYSVFYVDIKKQNERIIRSIEASFKNSIDGVRRNTLIRGDFPDKLKVAIKKFETFDISARIQAKFASERIMENYLRLLDLDIETVGVTKIYDEEDTTKEVAEKRDWNQVHAFVNATNKMNESFPELIKRIEEGYGVAKEELKSQTYGNKGMRDEFIELREEEEKHDKPLQ